MFDKADQYRCVSFAELLTSSEGPPIQDRFWVEGDLITTEVAVRLADEDRIALTVTAYGSNWWNTERIEETVIIGLPPES